MDEQKDVSIMPRICRLGFRFATLIALMSVVTFFGHLARAQDADFFEKKIRPILVENCYSCHSAEAKKLKGGLYLDSRQGVRNGGKDGPILVPGDPEHSRMIEAFRWTNADLKMPPKRRLSSEQMADLTAWVKQGCRDPRDAAKTVGGVDLSEARKQWAYHPPIAPAIPQVADPGMVSVADRSIHPGETGREGPQAGAVRRQADADPPGLF